MSGITYVIIVAVENYHQSNDFKKVRYAKNDALAIKEVFRLLGYDEQNFVALMDDHATRTAILHTVKTISERAFKNDRIIFYFAGHGFYEGGKNLLGPVDAIKTAIFDSSVPVEQILGILKTSASRQKILFLDCCHSGFEAGELERQKSDSFMADELLYQFSKEEYCIGFSSCKSHEISVSDIDLHHGVWSHFLISALKGEANKHVYTNGLLFGHKLQNWLNKQTSEFVKVNTPDKKDQTPMQFGSQTDDFIIADLTELFDEKARKERGEVVELKGIDMIYESSDEIKRLPGFKKGFHKVPNYFSSSTRSFVKQVGEQIVKDDIEAISTALREELQYKRADLKANVDSGSGSILTPDFTYSITIEQSETDYGEYIHTRILSEVTDPELAKKPEFNRVFDRHFDRLVFNVSKPIGIEKLIDAIEGLNGDSPISVKYPSDNSNCTISIEGLDHQINVDPDRFSIQVNHPMSPSGLIEVFVETRTMIAGFPELKPLLGNE